MAVMYIPPEGHTRRSMLKRGLWGGVLLALGGAGFLGLRASRQYPLPAEGLEALSPREYGVVWAIAERMIPFRAGWPGVDQVRVAFHADRTVARLSGDARSEIKGLLGLFENGLTQFLFEGRGRPFTQLNSMEQDEVLASWERSRLALRRTGFLALRTLVMACYYGHELSWPKVGYPGPPAGLHDASAPVWKGEGPRPSTHTRGPEVQKP